MRSWSAASARRSPGSRWRITSVNRNAPTSRPTARSHPPAWTEASWPGSPIATTFAPARSAASSSRAVRASRCHAGLVEHDHTPLRERVAELVEVDQQPVKRARRDAGLVGQLARSTARRRDTEDLVAGFFVELA